MAFGTVPLVATSDSWTASQHNTYIRDNFAAVWVGTTAGDIDYYTSATAKSRLAIGTANQLLQSTGSAPAWADLSTITAAKAMVASQAAGDTFYASSSTALARIAIGAAYTFKKSNGSTPSWGSITHRRYGGSSTAWGTAGTSTYTPTIELQQIGTNNLTLSGGSGTQAISFPVAYTANPHVMLTLVSIGSSDQFSAPILYALSTTGFTVAVLTTTGSSPTVQINWVARGQ